MVGFGKRNLFRRRIELRFARLHGLVRAGLCRNRVLWKLADRASADRAQRRTYAREADLRFGLVRVNERTEAIALYGGETDEKDYLNREFDQVLSMMRRLVSAITRLTWVTAGYGWFAIVAPFIVAAPGYFAGDMSLGD